MIRTRGFTVVELMVVIVVIGILAAITVVGYGSWRSQTEGSAVKHELTIGLNAISVYRTFNNANPPALSNTAYKSNPKVTLTYILRGNGTYCLNGQSIAMSSVVFHVETANENPVAGTCS